MARAMGSHQSARAKTCIRLTPPEIIEAIGPFDLDPCACSEPRPWPTARDHFTAEDDGLSMDWQGRVWCNPPYSPHSVVSLWMGRMAQHDRGTALIFARTETEMFFRTVWHAATAVLFLEGRLYFHYPDGTRAAANAGAPSCLVAYGAYDAYRLEHSGIGGKFISLR